MIATCQPWSLHALIQPSIIGAIAVAAKKTSDVHTVIEVNDSFYFMAKDPDSEACRLEKNILNQADVFVHKMPREAVCAMRSDWKLKTPDEKIHALPLKQLFRSCIPSETGSGARLVFAGGIMPYQVAMAKGHGEHVFDPLIHAAGKSSLDLTIYVNQNARNMYWHEHQRYIDFQKKYPSFKFLKGVPFFQLPQRLSAFNFGLHYENRANSKLNPDHFNHNMATKIFSYLEAGLPVLVPEKSRYLQRFIADHGLGISYDPDAIENLPTLIGKKDVTPIVQKIELFRKRHNMATDFPKLERIYAHHG